MEWNWQQPDWPNFSWDRGRLVTAEQEFLVGGGVLVGTVKHLETDERDQLTIEAMSTEAVTTSEIEGETWTVRASNPPYASNLDCRPTTGACGRLNKALRR